MDKEKHHEKVIPEKKSNFVKRVRELFRKYKKIALVCADNVSARQLLRIRHELDGFAEILFGKNRLMQRAVLEHKDEDPSFEALLPALKKGVGLIFTSNAFSKIQEVIKRNCVGSPAKVNSIAPVDVIIPPMRTSLPPTQVQVLHALNIQSKIFKGTIEITAEKALFKKGEKVGASEANILSLLGILPFEYTLTIVNVFDSGNLYSSEILNISNEVLKEKFDNALVRVLGLSLGIGYANRASAPHLIGAAFKDIAGLAVQLDYPVKQIADLQAILSDPEALAKAQAAAASSSSAAPSVSVSSPAAQPEPEPKKEEDEVVDLGGDLMDLFG